MPIFGIKTIDDLDLQGKKVLIRADLNVPIQEGKITSDARIRASIPTIERALEKGAYCVMVMSHLGRPKGYDEKFSLRPVADRLAELLGREVRFISAWIEGIEPPPKEGEVLLLENVRFLAGETKNDPELGRQMAALCDLFVMDAFASAHRAHASTHAVAQFAPEVCAGLLLARELEALTRALENPERPLLAIVGGAKVSTKLGVLSNLIERVDQLIVGGGIANTFLAAAGFPIGKSLYEPDLVPEAEQLLKRSKEKGAEIPLPQDVTVAKAFSAEAEAVVKEVSQVAEDEMILDIGSKTAEDYAKRIQEAKTIVWNGPVGVFEFDRFAGGTRRVTEAIAESSAFSIAGGGDTIAAIEKFGVANKISYISTAGGAFLEFLEGKELPAVEILKKRGTEG